MEYETGLEFISLLGLARTVSVPFESRVRRILVTEGQMCICGRSIAGNRAERRQPPPNRTGSKMTIKPQKSGGV